VISDIYATKERAKAADFITYSKVFDGVLVAKGNPKGIHRHRSDHVWRGRCGKYRFCGSAVVQDLGPKCKAEGSRSRTLALYDNNANCIPGHSRRPCGHLCQRRQHGGPGGEGNPDKLERRSPVDDPLFGRHRRAQTKH